MPYYTYGGYVCINKKYDAPEDHHIQSILKTHSDIYITSLFELMDESLQDLPKLFVDKNIKYWLFEYVKVAYPFPNAVKWNKKSDNMESMLIVREKRNNIISYVYFSKKFHVIRYSPGLNQAFGKKDITSPL